ncbi:MAG: CAT RNA binding domain-containing protein [Merdibacter sp.]
MKIKRVLNNNAVISSNSQNGDVLLGGGSLSRKRPGPEVDPQRVEKTFLLKDKEAQNRFTELMIDVPMAHILVVRRSSITRGQTRASALAFTAGCKGGGSGADRRPDRVYREGLLPYRV